MTMEKWLRTRDVNWHTHFCPLSGLGARKAQNGRCKESVSTDSDISFWPSVYQERLVDCQRMSGESRESARSPLPFDPMNPRNSVNRRRWIRRGVSPPVPCMRPTPILVAPLLSYML